MGVVLVTRRECHLCDAAASLLRRSLVDFEVRDVDADPDLLRLYDFRVPVILLDGRVIAEGRIGEGILLRLSQT